LNFLLMCRSVRSKMLQPKWSLKQSGKFVLKQANLKFSLNPKETISIEKKLLRFKSERILSKMRMRLELMINNYFTK
jgi:hypothetical protein